VVFDNWIDGVGGSPDDVMAELRNGDAQGTYQVPVHAGWDRGRVRQLGVPGHVRDGPRDRAGQPVVPAADWMAGSVGYPFYLMNGRLPNAPETFTAQPGQRVRIRLVSAAGTTVFRVALGGHRLTVTHADGFPVEPVTVDTLHVGSGER
jgi:FtsP/CotA-like multicopper oxidase with cupredoxin domain